MTWLRKREERERVWERYLVFVFIHHNFTPIIRPSAGFLPLWRFQQGLSIMPMLTSSTFCISAGCWWMINYKYVMWRKVSGRKREKGLLQSSLVWKQGIKKVGFFSLPKSIFHNSQHQQQHSIFNGLYMPRERRIKNIFTWPWNALFLHRRKKKVARRVCCEWRKVCKTSMWSMKCA